MFSKNYSLIAYQDEFDDPILSKLELCVDSESSSTGVLYKQSLRNDWNLLSFELEFFSKTELNKLSEGIEFLTCDNSSTTGYSSCVCFNNGSLLWSLVYDSNEDIIESNGDIPAIYNKIRDDVLWKETDSIQVIPIIVLCTIVNYDFDNVGCVTNPVRIDSACYLKRKNT